MANRYWVGGAGNWSSTTKWSATSGGASGASVPTSVDDAIFDANSGGKFIATVDTAQTVNSISITPSAAVGVLQIALSARLTTGALTTTSTAGNNRIWFRGTTYGIAQDFSISGAVSIFDCDFRDIYVVGTAAPISGTRIGDLRGIRGITASTPKTAYWNLAAGGNWSDNAWAATSGGAVSTDNFPLAQDTAVIENTGLNTSATVTLNAVLPFIGTLNMSTRTNAATISFSFGNVIYGDLVTGSGITYSGSGLTYSGRNTQTITSAGKAISGGITINSFGGTVQLADALNTSSGGGILVSIGTFSTQNYNITALYLWAYGAAVRAISLGSSTVTLSTANIAIDFSPSTNLTFSAGTSSIILTGDPSGEYIKGGGQTFYDVTSPFGGLGYPLIAGANVFNNFTWVSPFSASRPLRFSENQTINGTLTVAGTTAVSRNLVCSDTFGTTRTLTVNSLAATNCDFRDITIAGAAAGSSPTRAGDCGGNAGITFPAPKTVYWNLAGAQNWSATGWCSSSGGTPAVNNFPLAQDTAVFDDAGSVTGTISVNSNWNLGTFDASARTTAMTFTTLGFAFYVYNNWKSGTGVTPSGTTGSVTFVGRGTSTITSNGVTFGCSITINTITGTVQLADALTLGATRTLTLTSGTFDAVTYNVTTGLFASATGVSTLRMGSGTWTLSGTGTVWSMSGTNQTFYKGTANIVLSDTSTTARTFAGGSFSYNKLTIGGATGTSTLTISGNNQFTELASTKTVAHTIALGSSAQVFGKWSVTGTAGNIVTLTGTSNSSTIAGARVSGVDYLAMGTVGFSTASSGEFYAGANSTGTGTGIIFTAAPTSVTRYWVGGTGTWDATTTTNWSATSGGAGGASVPTSADAVVFDSASHATAYTVTCTDTQLRCGALTFAGPASGNVTWAGTAPLAIHDNVTLPATGMTRTYTGAITLSGSATGKTFTTNGVTLRSVITVNGVGCGWSLGSALTTGASSTFFVTNGEINFSTYNLTSASISTDSGNSCAINLGSGTITLSGSIPIGFGTTETVRANLAVTTGTSQINCASSDFTFNGNNQTFYNVAFTSTTPGTVTVNGANTFNNLSGTGANIANLKNIRLSANQTINGTLTLSAGTNATMRTFVQSNTLGTTRTITAAAFSGTDADFRDITIAGAAAPVSGTRLGDCKGNSGITFSAGVTRYWNLAAGGNWSATGWAATSGGTPAANNFPLAQDTALFEATGLNSGATVTFNAAYNIGTIDMSARTSNGMSLSFTNSPSIYGNLVMGTGSGAGSDAPIRFLGRGNQTITSAGIPFSQRIAIYAIGGTVTLQDAFTGTDTTTTAFVISDGTFNANSYNVTLSGCLSADLNSFKTIAIGSGTWTIAGAGASSGWTTSANSSVTGTGTISLTSASAKTFAGGGISYAGITLNQGGAGTLTITGNNTFKNITNTYKATGATSIALGTTTQRVDSFTAAGEAGRVLTVTGASASSPATLILTGVTDPNVDYLAITGVRAYDLTNTWYAGANSTNNGSLGWYFEAAGGGAILVYISESSTAADAQSSLRTLNPTVAEVANATDALAAGLVYLGTLSESATASDLTDAIKAYLASVAESATSTDLIAASLTFAGAISELTRTSDAQSTQITANASIAELIAAADSLSGGLLFLSNISESAVPADIAVSGLIFNRAVAEASTASEVLAAIAVFRAAVPEQVSGADVLSTLLTMGGAINEALTALDSILGPKTTSPTVAEAAAVSEAQATAYTANPSITELVRGAETAQVVASIFGAAAAETANPLDAAQGANTGSSTLSESATVNETGAAAFTAEAAVSEAAAGLDDAYFRSVFTTEVIEALAAADQSSVAPSTFSAVALAAAQLFDSPSPAGSTYNAIVPMESAGISDTTLGSYLWNTINDSQPINWQNVSNPQGAGWVVSSTNADPNWQITPET